MEISRTAVQKRVLQNLKFRIRSEKSHFCSPKIIFSEVKKKTPGYIYAAIFLKETVDNFTIKNIFLSVPHTISLMNGFPIIIIVPVEQKLMVLENSINPSFTVLHLESNTSSDSERDEECAEVIIWLLLSLYRIGLPDYPSIKSFIFWMEIMALASEIHTGTALVDYIGHGGNFHNNCAICCDRWDYKVTKKTEELY